MNPMRSAETKNGRKVTILELEDCQGKFESVPAKPFGALVIVVDDKLDRKAFKGLATRLLEAGCAWTTLHAGKNTQKLHQAFDDAIVEYQLTEDSDADMDTSGEDEDNLEESMRDAVWLGYPSYGDPFAELLVLILGKETERTAEQAESLAAGVEQA